MLKKSLITIMILLLIFGCGKVAKQVTISDPEPIAAQSMTPIASNPQDVISAVQSLGSLYMSGVGVPVAQTEVTEMPTSFKVNRAQSFSTCALESTQNYAYWYYKTGTKFNGTVQEKVDTMYRYFDTRTGKLFDHFLTASDFAYIGNINQIDNIEGYYPDQPSKTLYRVRYDELAAKQNGQYVATPYPNGNSWFEYYAYVDAATYTIVPLTVNSFTFKYLSNGIQGFLDCNNGGVRVTASINVVGGVANSMADFIYGDKKMASVQLAGAVRILTTYYVGKAAQYYYQDLTSLTRGIEDNATFELDAGTYTGIAVDGTQQLALNGRLKNFRIVSKSGVASGAVTISDPLTLSNMDSVWVKGVSVIKSKKVVSPIFNNCTDTQYNP